MPKETEIIEPERKLVVVRKRLVLIIVSLALGLVVGYYLGYNSGIDKAAEILVR